MEASQGKLETKMETNQEIIEAVAEHYNGAPRIKTTHLLTTLQDRACDVLHEATKWAVYKDTVRALEYRFWDQNLAIGYGIN
jgi:hypothetical protein